MSKIVIEKEVYEEIMKNINLGAGLDLDMPIVKEEEYKVESKTAPEAKKTVDEEKSDRWCKLPKAKVSCDLEVAVGNKNMVIYVCPGKIQYFTASASKCCGDETIEIEYIGHNTKSVYGEKIICGNLGYYKIVKSGILFIPRHNLSEFPTDWYPTDILSFKAKSVCEKDVEFVVVFTYSRCECGCDKSCKCK